MANLKINWPAITAVAVGVTALVALLGAIVGTPVYLATSLEGRLTDRIDRLSENLSRGIQENTTLIRDLSKEVRETGKRSNENVYALNRAFSEEILTLREDISAIRANLQTLEARTRSTDAR